MLNRDGEASHFSLLWIIYEALQDGEHRPKLKRCLKKEGVEKHWSIKSSGGIAVETRRFLIIQAAKCNRLFDGLLSEIFLQVQNWLEEKMVQWIVCLACNYTGAVSRRACAWLCPMEEVLDSSGIANCGCVLLPSHSSLPQPFDGGCWVQTLRFVEANWNWLKLVARSNEFAEAWLKCVRCFSCPAIKSSAPTQVV